MPRRANPYEREQYGLKWGIGMEPTDVELHMLRKGGRWKKKDGTFAGEGYEFHFRRLMELLWPDLIWHRWAEKQLRAYLNYRIIGQVGAASTGKSFIAAAYALAKYYIHPGCTTVMVSSTTRESLEMRVWGEIKKLHRAAKSRFPWLEGYLIEGRQRIVTDPRTEAAEGRDFRNGLVGVACKRGQTFQGMEEYVGIKNKHLLMVADELQFMPRQFVDAISNMNKNPGFQCIGSGNPKETVDALGVLCEPAAHLGGWDGGIDQTPGAKEWEIRFPKGICLQLPGSDSPNLDGKLGIPLITQEQIDADIKFYGKDSLQYTMMDEGRMPRGLGSKRVITRQICLKFGAMEEPFWEGSPITRIASCDAAYRGTGGDRTVFMELRFGKNSEHKNILAIIETLIVPVRDLPTESPEDQIAAFIRNECERRGISPENFGFDSTGRGSLMSAFARLWSPNVIPIEFGGKPTERPVANGIDMTCRDYYYDFVSELWYSTRLLIEAGQLRGLTDEVMLEGCARETGKAGANKTFVEPKDKMKLKCFVAGTMVKTPDRDSPIERIRVGQLVSTPLGPSPVIAVQKYTATSLVRARFSDGTSLLGTPTHKIFTWNRGWVPLNQLLLTDRLESSRVQMVWQLLNAFFTVETGTTFRETINTISVAAGGTGTRSDLCTELSTTILKDAFLRVGTFITKMATPLTTIREILNSNWKLNTVLSTLSATGNMVAAKCSVPSGGPGTRCELGTNPARAGSGTAPKPRSCGITKNREPLPARFAADPLSQPAYRLPGSVPCGATADTGVTKARWKRIARFVERILLLALTIRQRPARLIAVESFDGQEQEVYDLTLLNHNVYYASNILVSNSGRSPDLYDCFVAGLEVARRKGFLIERITNRYLTKEGSAWKKELKERSLNIWRNHELSYR